MIHDVEFITTLRLEGRCLALVPSHAKYISARAPVPGLFLKTYTWLWRKERNNQILVECSNLVLTSHSHPEVWFRLEHHTIHFRMFVSMCIDEGEGKGGQILDFWADVSSLSTPPPRRLSHQPSL